MPEQIKRRTTTDNDTFLRKHVRGLGRWFKYQYLLLTRAKGGAAIVAMGFSIGLAIEMFTLPTFGLAFFLIFPLVYLLRASLAAALIGFVFGKIIYIPVAFLNAKVGGLLVPDRFDEWLAVLPHWIGKALAVNAKLIAGGIVDGAMLAAVLYMPLRYVLELFARKRTERRKKRRDQLALVLKETNS